MSDTEREAFEAWVRSSRMHREYTPAAWLAWQERARRTTTTEARALSYEEICKLAADTVPRADYFPPEDWIAFARAVLAARAPAPPLEAMRADEFRDQLAALIDIWDDGQKPYDDRAYTSSAFTLQIEEAREVLAAPPVDMPAPSPSLGDPTEAPSAVPQAPQWISVEDRLPQPDEDVLIWSERRGGLEVAGFRPWARDDECWTINGTFSPRAEATHWMPLPAPPNEAGPGTQQATAPQDVRIPGWIKCPDCDGSAEHIYNDRNGDPQWDYAVPCQTCAVTAPKGARRVP